MSALATLDEPAAGNVVGYDRTLFGQSWYDSDRNGCDTRNDILRRDLSDVMIKSDSNGCKVLRGGLIDPYSGDAMTFVSGADTSVLVQIDHVVPLAWAWDNGASTWTTEQRQDFANDPLNLLAVSGQANQEKSASGPASWMPPNRDAHCVYVTIFTKVLVEYRLSVPSDDRTVLTQVLSGC
ncbi:HNH endonuclease family protein [Microcella sp.]|uniref:HNH endonuclease family protein n=1 Tax=Microcella sp. TaxID=1913979 RepID=UPI0025D24835|nr:HNH endonuclease family protein [Microcella sp.]